MSPSAKKSSVTNLPSKILRSNLLDFEPDLLKNVLRYIGDELLIINEQGRILYANDAALDGMGCSSTALIGAPITRFFKKRISLPQWKRTHLANLKRSRRPVSYQIERKGKNKQTQLIDLTAVYIFFDGKGYVLSVGRDVTRQVSLQEGLRESKNLYRILSEGAEDGIITLSLSGEITYINPAMARLLEISDRTQESRFYTHFLSPKDSGRARKIFQSVKSGKKFTNQTVDFLTQSGMTIPVELSVAPLYQGHKVIGAHSIVRDLRPHLEKGHLQREAEKMEALKYFISGAVHELKNPLLGVSRIAESILKKYKDRDFEYISCQDFSMIFLNIERMRSQIEDCYETADRLLQLSQEKVHLSRSGADPKSAIQKVIEVKGTIFKRNDIRLKISFCKSTVRVRMGQIDFSQVISNILDNAIQAMESGGLLTVAIALSKDKKMCLIDIRDQGIGIPQEDLAHIFEPFFTTKSRGVHKNSGLGLSIVYALIKSALGEIQVKSNQRQGTHVRITLPVVQGRSAKV